MFAVIDQETKEYIGNIKLIYRPYSQNMWIWSFTWF